MTPHPAPQRSRLVRHLVLACAWLALGLASLFAQTGTGTIAGRVFNPATGEYVRNAEVRIAGTEQIASTAGDGSFRFDRVPVGAVTLTVTYTGYHRRRRRGRHRDA